MSRLRFYLCFAVIYSCSTIGQGGLTTKAPVIIPVNPSPSDVLPVFPVEGAASPVDPDDSKHPNTTTSTTTTTPPTTTTTAPTTTKTPPTTTTTPPTTTSTTQAPPAPTPKPGPLPPAEKGSWSYKDPETNVTCIVIQFAAQLNVTYNKVVENVTSLGNVILNVPAKAVEAGGNCTGDEQWLKLTWMQPISNLSQPNYLTVVFQRNKTNYVMKSMNISLSPDLFVNSTSKVALDLYHGSEWMTPLSTSYRCTTPIRLNMSSESPSVVAAMTLNNLQEEAFRTTTNKDFSSARECGGGDVPDAVPIAVGCALGGLVVVVLIAYLVARRRSAARGYLSM